VTALLKVDRAIAAGIGDRFVLRQPPPSGLLAGGFVLDPAPPSSRARRRQTPERLARLAVAVEAGDDDAIDDARLALHGLLRVPGPTDDGVPSGPAASVRVADDLRAEVTRAVETLVAAFHASDPGAPGMPLTDVRRAAAVPLRQATGTAADVAEAADGIIATLIASGRLRRDGDTVAVAGHRPAAPDPARAAAMERLLSTLDVAAPPPLREAAAGAGCPTDAVRELERDARIVVVDDDLAWSASAWERLRDLALGLARDGTLTPAALRDASGTSRKYVMALLEDLQRRGILTRTRSGHVPGPRS
jgi:selenocysteine-specific elongation factor